MPTNSSAQNDDDSRTLELRWIEMEADETPRHPDVMDRIMARELDGITVEGVFTPEECDRAIKHLERWKDERMPAMFGSMLGMPLANVPLITDDPDDITPYFDDAERSRAMYRAAFGADPHDRVASVLRPLCGGRTVGCPTDGDRAYSAGNVRWYEPDSPHLAAHVGNEFKTHSDAAAAQLRSTTRTIDHFSWFVVLQTPEVGGALSVYDLLFESHTPADPDYGVMGRDDSDFDQLPARRVAPRQGGMVFFGGGWRWHRVDPIGGDRQRVTYGGFAGPTLDRTRLNLWF